MIKIIKSITQIIDFVSHHSTLLIELSDLRIFKWIHMTSKYDVVETENGTYESVKEASYIYPTHPSFITGESPGIFHRQLKRRQTWMAVTRHIVSALRNLGNKWKDIS